MSFSIRHRPQMNGFLQPAIQLVHHADTDVDIDLEASFASNFSLHSPPRQSLLATTPDSEDGPTPMDISPCPPPKPALSATLSKPFVGRPRAFTSSARLFGRDMSNDDLSQPSPQFLAPKPAPQEPAKSISSSKTQRAGLPMEWLRPSEVTLSQQPLVSPITEDTDAMDVDSDPIHPSPAPVPSNPIKLGNPFDAISHSPFHEDSFSFSSKPKKKPRRSLSPESLCSIRGSHVRQEPFDDLLSSPPHEVSPSEQKLQRQHSVNLLARFNQAASSTKPMLQGLGAPPPNALKRPRRPALSAMVNPSDVAYPQSAYPITGEASVNEDAPSSDDNPLDHPNNNKQRLPPTRRAFSALLPPTSLAPFNKANESFGSDESSFDMGSSPAQAYAKRQHVKTIRRCDGTEDFRPLTGVTALVERERGSSNSGHQDNSTEMSPASKMMRNMGLPGFGDNESSGKILPCHRVREDGLMRIKVNTLNDLLDGKYKPMIKDFYVIDCRFDYEYTGGHVPGAINVRSTAALEELLLGDCLPKPKPSVSGDPDRKTILVFHCEFSAKRAPTFAKHLRSKDRSMNGHVYPRIHYPEVYILEGGYCQYFKSSASRCEPPQYVRMDDPNFSGTCKTEMDMFRKGNGKEGVGKTSTMTRSKFGRHRSYAYGELGTATTSSSTRVASTTTLDSQTQKKRNTAPAVGAGSLFAAANMARTRRNGFGDNGLKALKEHEPARGSDETTDEETDIGDSPCPPSNKNANLFKTKNRLSSMDPRGTLMRAETYGPARMAY